MQCPHCLENIKAGAVKCPHCTGGIAYEKSAYEAGIGEKVFIYTYVIVFGLLAWLEISKQGFSSWLHHTLTTNSGFTSQIILPLIFAIIVTFATGGVKKS